MTSLEVLLAMRWHYPNDYRIPGWCLAALDDLSLYALVPINEDHNHVWEQAVLFTDWKRAHGLFKLRANAYLRRIAEDGKVAYIESGRDCDCVEYDGLVHIVDATWEAFEKLSDDIAEWADGPFYLRRCRVSETRGVRYESRDLALEAFEDGHPHHIVSRFP